MTDKDGHQYVLNALRDYCMPDEEDQEDQQYVLNTINMSISTKLYVVVL